MSYQSYFPERYTDYMKGLELTSVINDLELAYDQTGNEIIYRLLRKFCNMQQQVRNSEIMWNQRDFEEILNNPQLFPEAVRFWAFQYRDIENQ